MTTIGFALHSNGKRYLQCASAHLTAFVGLVVDAGMPVGANIVNPVTDAGTLTVGCVLHYRDSEMYCWC